MFETAEVGNLIEQKLFDREAPRVRHELLSAQRELASSKTSLVILVSGVEGGGKSETVNLLMEWMDARGIDTQALWGEPSDEEKERPEFWRFWRVLPPTGRTTIFIGSWYTRPILDRAFGKLSEAKLAQKMDRIVEFEKMLVREGTLLVKFWLHLSRSAQKSRLKRLESDPKTRWRVSKLDWKFFKRYEELRSASEEALRRTNTPHAPWTIVEATDSNYRSLSVARTLTQALRARLQPAPAAERTPPEPPQVSRPNVISRLDLTHSLSKEKYERKIHELQAQLNRLTRKLFKERRSMILVFEGPDAAGKGGAIRRLTHVMDARDYRVISVGAPTDEERAHPYLWRFWRHLPRLGRVTIYDRSWYGRVLVERLEGFCTEEEWRRAYGEINQFEEQLTDFGIVLLKFWLAIGPDEQLRRFKERQTTPYKQYKISAEDWRNRAKWEGYEAAACDMIERTSTAYAPWTLVEANDKDFARMKIFRTVCGRLEKELE
jgi:polyphosphate:AMP phosphotransferase